MGSGRNGLAAVSERFAEATAVERIGDGRWSAEILEGWDIVGRAHGGYMLAIAARALAVATGRRDPITVTGHFLTPGRSGPVTIDTDVIRGGRRFTTATATMRDGDGRPLLTVLGTLGDLDESDGPELIDATMPAVPDPADCVLMVPSDPLPPSLMSKVELRIHPDDVGFYKGEPSGTPQMRGWFRLRDDEPIDSVALLCAVDAFPPTTFNAQLPVGWTPTLELTAHIRGRPQPGWLRCAFRTRFISGGFLEADGEIWDGAGRLVAQSRQLALVAKG